MSHVQEVETALAKAMALADKVEEMIERLPATKRRDLSLQRMRGSAHATVVNLGMALQIAKKMERGDDRAT
jgi:hypothetical protein